jgi:ribosomal protein L11 methyltransferase
LATYPALDLRYAPGPGAGALQDLLYAELDEFEPIAIAEHETGDGWRVFFGESIQRDAARHALAGLSGGHVLDITSVDVEDEDWARRSQANLKAIHAGRVVVAPPWDVPPPDPSSNDIVIVIEPSMGFGTGHHATTRLCLELLQEVDLAGRNVIDVGTGSGVLAIAAWRLGASAVIAIDNDPDALLNARENVDRNGASGAVDLHRDDLSSASIEPADVVTANLTGAVLQKYADALTELVTEAGTLIVSGFSPDELDDVLEALGSLSARVVTEGEWAAAVVQMTES